MPRPSPDLLDILDAVTIDSPAAFSIDGDRFDLAPDTAPGDQLAASLAHALYFRKYSRTGASRPAPASNPRAARVFVETLSRANCGTGTWEPGWVVEAVEPDGTLVVRRTREGLLVWAPPEWFRSTSGVHTPGTAGRVRVARELRAMMPGYYACFGDADRGIDVPSRAADVVRFYWHLTAEGAPLWIASLTTRFNQARVPFHAKVLSDPAMYHRADAGVLYVARPEVGAALALLPALHRDVAGKLRATTPMFTRRLADGLAVAEDPGDGSSFGQHRCQLVADGLVRAFECQDATLEGRLRRVAARFGDAGVSLTAPWLNRGSTASYRWTTARPRRPRRPDTQRS
jgi:hypothetical protein